MDTTRFAEVPSNSLTLFPVLFPVGGHRGGAAQVRGDGTAMSGWHPKAFGTDKIARTKHFRQMCSVQLIHAAAEQIR